MSERREYHALEEECSRDFIVTRGNLVADEINAAGRYKLDPGSELFGLEKKEQSMAAFESPETLHAYFEDVPAVEPDHVCRPKGESTFFTTAGVQHIETILRERGALEKETFAISQPSLRSQFMDKVTDGTSTSFINFSVELIDADPEAYIGLSNDFTRLLVEQGIPPDDLRFEIEKTPDEWGKKAITKTIVTFYFKGIELGECVYIHDYPATADKKVAIADLGFGVERVRWAIDERQPFFPEFARYYDENSDSNKVTSIIDPLRSMVLIAAEGVRPSNHDHGYRLRQFSKRFVSRRQGVAMDLADLVHTAYASWVHWGQKPSVDESVVLEVLTAENDRNFNALFLKELEGSGYANIYVDINQRTADFAKQMEFSLSSEAISQIIEKIK